MDGLSRLDASRLPFALGNPVFAVRSIASVIPEMSRLEHWLAYAELRREIAARAARWTPGEREAIRALLAGLREEEPFESERLALLDRLAAAAEREAPVPEPGRAYLLTVAKAPSLGEYGLVHPLDVLADTGGDSVRFEHVADDDAQFHGFYKGVWAAQEYLRRQERTALNGIRGYSIRGWIPDLPRRSPIAGPSLGLSSAMAALSAVLQLPIPADVAFTGRVDPRGRVYGVPGIASKLQAARDKGIRAVYVPLDNRDEAERGRPADLAVQAIATLDAAVQGVWPPAAFAAALARAHRRPGDSTAEPQARGAAAAAGGGRCVLLSCVGKADPFDHLGQTREQPSPIATEEGPILTICRLLRPAAAYLFYTPMAEGASDYASRAARVHQTVREMLPECAVELTALAGIADPSNYTELVPVFRRAVAAIVARESQYSAAFVVNLSSGTPQMETTWHLLRAWRVLPARLLQVREPRFVTSKESRVREVALPAYS